MKKLYLSILYVVLLSLLIGGAILLSKPVEKSKYNKGTIEIKKSNDIVSDNSQESVNAYKNEILKNETIKVFNNEADINLHANLVEDKSGQVLLCLSYKSNGKVINKNIGTSNVSEIRNIFRFREVNANGYRLNNMILNKKMNKLYFCVEGKKDKKYTHTSIYSYSLKNSKIEKVFYGFGNFSQLSLSPDGKYYVFSYLWSPQNIIRNEKNIVIITRCSDNKPILNSNEDIITKQNANSNDLYVYSYDFIKWQNNSICELRQRIKAKDDSQKVKEHTVFYNVKLNKIVNMIE
jgi:hypothetical protein